MTNLGRFAVGTLVVALGASSARAQSVYAEDLDVLPIDDLELTPDGRWAVAREHRGQSEPTAALFYDLASGSFVDRILLGDYAFDGSGVIQDAVAVTDHGNIHGAVSFYEKARDAGIKPILGVEAYVAAGDRRDRTRTGVSDGGYHLVLLAENETGWNNLLHLCSEAYLTGFYYKPRMDRELLEELKGLGYIQD